MNSINVNPLTVPYLSAYLTGEVTAKGIATVLWLKDVPFPYAEKSPPDPDLTWAGLLYNMGIPWKIYDFSHEKKKDTWRKI